MAYNQWKLNDVLNWRDAPKLLECCQGDTGIRKSHLFLVAKTHRQAPWSPLFLSTAVNNVVECQYWSPATHFETRSWRCVLTLLCSWWCCMSGHRSVTLLDGNTHVDLQRVWSSWGVSANPRDSLQHLNCLQSHCCLQGGCFFRDTEEHSSHTAACSNRSSLFLDTGTPGQENSAGTWQLLLRLYILLWRRTARGFPSWPAWSWRRGWHLVTPQGGVECAGGGVTASSTPQGPSGTELLSAALKPVLLQDHLKMISRVCPWEVVVTEGPGRDWQGFLRQDLAGWLGFVWWARRWHCGYCIGERSHRSWHEQGSGGMAEGTGRCEPGYGKGQQESGSKQREQTGQQFECEWCEGTGNVLMLLLPPARFWPD